MALPNFCIQGRLKHPMGHETPAAEASNIFIVVAAAAIAPALRNPRLERSFMELELTGEERDVTDILGLSQSCIWPDQTAPFAHRRA